MAKKNKRSSPKSKLKSSRAKGGRAGPRVNKGADKKAILKLDAEWGDAATRGDLDAVVGFYAADGSLVWQGEPAAHGTKEITAMWKGMLTPVPGIEHGLRFTAERIEVADAGDIATDFGVVEFTTTTPKGTTKELAKYLVVWKKVRGVWKVLYDCYSYNTNPTPPAAGGTGDAASGSVADAKDGVK